MLERETRRATSLARAWARGSPTSRASNIIRPTCLNHLQAELQQQADVEIEHAVFRSAVELLAADDALTYNDRHGTVIRR